MELYSEMFTSFYLNKYNGKVFYDPNLKTNYRLVSEIYNSSINVLTECNKQTTQRLLYPIEDSMLLGII